MSTMPYPNPQAIFYQQYESVRRDEVVGVMLALFLGCFGIHHFYLGRVGLGILYCLFSWTGIPAVLGFIECFFMPGRVRMYNAVQAAGLAAALGIGIPGWAGYPGWVAPGFGGPGYGGYAQPAQPINISVQTPAVRTETGETTLVACANCGHANPAGARFCSGCGTQAS
jgi:TM2 domain-containing membrane protein YozV